MAIITNSIPDETLAEGEEVITKVLNPQINKDGKMVQTAQIEVTVGTKKGGLTREQWLEEQKKKETRTDKINAKYDAELAELEKSQPTNRTIIVIPKIGSSYHGSHRTSAGSCVSRYAIRSPAPRSASSGSCHQ